jgi:acyl carrier protein
LCNEGNEYLNSEEGFLKAIELYDRAISLNPRLAIAWNNKGYVLNQLEKYEDAILVLERAIQLNPDFVSVYNNYGDAFYGLDKYSEAIDAYDECIKIDPENHQSWWNKGFTFLNLEQPELALQSFDKCIEINDQNPNLWLIFCMKAFGYIQLEDFDKSIDNLAEAIRVNPSKAREYIIQTEEFNCFSEDLRFQKLIGLDSINCPRCGQINPINKYIDSINCSRCGCFINVTARLDEVSFATNNLQTFEKVQDIVASQLGVDKTEIDLETSFVNDLGADELDIVELMMALEEEFGIEIPDEDIEEIKTVQDAVNYIESYLET